MAFVVGEILETACDLGGTCRGRGGGVLALFGVANRLKKKIKFKSVVALDGHQTTNKKVSTNQKRARST